MPTFPRLFAFAREHQEQARAGRDEIRAALWDNIINQLLDRQSFHQYLAAEGR